MKFYTLVIHSSAQHWKVNGTLTSASFASYNSFNFFHLVNLSLEIRNCCVILLHVFLALLYYLPILHNHHRSVSCTSTLAVKYIMCGYMVSMLMDRPCNAFLILKLFRIFSS